MFVKNFYYSYKKNGFNFAAFILCPIWLIFNGKLKISIILTSTVLILLLYYYLLRQEILVNVTPQIFHIIIITGYILLCLYYSINANDVLVRHNKVNSPIELKKRKKKWFVFSWMLILIVLSYHFYVFTQTEIYSTTSEHVLHKYYKRASSAQLKTIIPPKQLRVVDEFDQLENDEDGSEDEVAFLSCLALAEAQAEEWNVSPSLIFAQRLAYSITGKGKGFENFRWHFVFSDNYRKNVLGVSIGATGIIDAGIIIDIEDIIQNWPFLKIVSDLRKIDYEGSIKDTSKGLFLKAPDLDGNPEWITIYEKTYPRNYRLESLGVYVDPGPYINIVSYKPDGKEKASHYHQLVSEYYKDENRPKNITFPHMPSFTKVFIRSD